MWLDFRELSFMLGGMATEPAVGTKIKRARERLRWTQKKLADEVGVSQKTIDNWENGRTSPKSSIGALEQVLGIALDGEPQPDPDMPTPAEMERLLEHVREVLGDKAAPVEAALKRVADGSPPSRGRGGAEEYRPARRPAAS